MSDPRMLVFEAGLHLAKVEAAKASVEQAKVALEQARAAVEAAKAEYSEAKAVYDEFVVKCEEAGIPKAGLKRASEMITLALAEVGLEPAADTVAEEGSVDKDGGKGRRRRRSKDQDEVGSVDEATASEAASAVVGESGGEASAAEAPAGVNEAPQAEEDSGEQAPEVVAAVAYDFSAEKEEVVSLIDELIPAGVDARHDGARSFLVALVDAYAFVAVASNGAFTVDSFRDGLDRQKAFDAAEFEGLPEDVGAALLQGLADDDADRVLAWTRVAFTALENGESVSEKLFEEVAAAGDAKAEETPAVHTEDYIPDFGDDDFPGDSDEDDVGYPEDEETPASAEVTEAPQAVAETAAAGEPEYAFEDEPEFAISDDDSFTAEVESVVEGETVAIEEINFLADEEPAAAPVASAAEKAPAAAVAQPEAEAPKAEEKKEPAAEAPKPEAPKPSSGFTPPAFLARKR